MAGNSKKIGIGAGIGVVAIVGIMVVIGSGFVPSNSFSDINQASTTEQVSTPIATSEIEDSVVEGETMLTTKTIATAQQTTPNLVTAPLTSLLPIRDDIGTEYRIGTVKTDVVAAGGLGNLTDRAGFEEAIDQSYITNYGRIDVELVRFDTIENAKKPYEEYTSKLYNEGGFTEINVNQINADCLGKDKTIADIYCVKSNIYYHIHTSSQIHNSVAIQFADIVTDKLESYTGSYIENKKTYTNSGFGYAVEYPAWWKVTEGYVSGDVVYDASFDTGNILDEMLIMSEDYGWGKSFDSYFDEFRERARSADMTIVSEQKTEIGGNTAYVFKVQSYAKAKIVVFGEDNAATLLLYRSGIGTMDDNDTYWFDKIAESFRFL